jgi:hypothetical protein
VGRLNPSGSALRWEESLSNKVEDTLAQLGAAFAVRDIMVRYEDLQLVDDESEARRFFEEQEDYDYTASPKTGRITTYYKRDELKGQLLRQEDLLSDGTGLLDLLDLLTARDFFFVLSANRICGFVHFSDLNDELVKLPLFVLLAAAERRLWHRVREGLTEAELEGALVPERLKQVLERFEEAKVQRADRDLEGLLFFGEILKLAKNRGLIPQISSDDRGRLNDTRNRVAHHDRLLVEKHKDVRKLAKIRDLCRELMS